MTNLTPAVYHVIGLMSGTSLDGLDIAFCRFSLDEKGWNYEVLEAETRPYTAEWKERLLGMESATAAEFSQLNEEYGFFTGRQVADFVARTGIKADFVASHGHTIFHQPDKHFTVQAGAGSAVAAACKLPVVCDFRSLDVALGGQGAPLVPVGDRLLFADYDYCLNLGGFANISYEHNGRRIAFDICPVNIVMNAVCEKIGKAYDDKGEIARSGMVSMYMLHELNQLPFYRLNANTPKSLGKEWVIENVDPIIAQYEIAENDLLHTLCEHVAIQVARATDVKQAKRMLITGGGAYNDYLIERIKALTKHEVIIPDKRTIEFKEAMIFAFLGVLRMRNEINCLRSVTGARADSCGGAIYIC